MHVDGKRSPLSCSSLSPLQLFCGMNLAREDHMKIQDSQNHFFGLSMGVLLWPLLVNAVGKPAPSISVSAC